ncbi:UDP-N-acetylmuramate dehydrogenase [Patescibacteria group bacterium]|nr:UDP-N-acetylmuramate dehydrogenase [Patescibacteria group bacterium]
MTDITKQLKDVFADRLKEKELLSKHLNFRIGGPAMWFVEAVTIEEIEHAIKIVKDAGVEYFVLGGGSNTLASDEGFEGLVIKIAMREHRIDGTTVMAEAGVISASLARSTANAGLAGFTWAISLPGTVGGAVRGNAGCFGGEMKDVVTKVEVLREGQVLEFSKDDLKFGYRDSAIKHSADIVLRVWMELEEGDPEELKKELQEKLSARKATQPLYAGSAGCVFKNYEIQSDEELARIKQDHEIPEEMLKARRISAGWIIDQLDLKGMKIGNAMISKEHGNFIVNLGKATASDVIQLISLIKTKTRERYGIQLQEEVQYLGF